jgi:hypothetical protein
MTTFLKRTAMIVATFTLFSPAFAAKAKDVRQQMHNETSTKGTYGTAGCGLGSMAFGNQPGYIQIVAATLNATGMQVFAITTGTSNCDIPSNGQQASMFIESNGETLRKEVSRGQGETVNSLAMILNCKDSQLFGETMRAHFGDVMSEEASSLEKTRRILSTIQATPELKKSCQLAG